MSTIRFLALAGAAVLLVPAVVQGRERHKTPDACSLITAPEIRAVQREDVVATKGSRPMRRDFAVSQCFYTVATFAKSISLEVTRRDPDGAANLSPKDEWMRLFHAGSKGGEEDGRPRPVAGVGDEAFWISDGVVGALYVLKNDAYLRISIGGAEEQNVRLEKSRKLAGKALKRM